MREFAQGRGPCPGLSHWEEGHVVFGEALIDGFTFGFEGRAVAGVACTAGAGCCFLWKHGSGETGDIFLWETQIDTSIVHHVNVYGHEGHLEGCSHDEIRRLHFDSKVTPWSCRYPSGSTHQGSSVPIL